MTSRISGHESTTTFKLKRSVEKPKYPSHDQSLGLIHRITSQDKHKVITIISNNYLKNIREELLEEEANQLQQTNSEIVHIKATINGIITIIMVDTGSNTVSYTHLDVYKRQLLKLIYEV